jgi:sugar/nucleoside kinase (ribokinase family)
MPSDEVRASATILAPPERVYGIIADYRDGHPRIVPPKYFRWMRVESGGIGEGTTIAFGMRVLGVTRTLRAIVSEPEPGRLLVETYPKEGFATSFIVDPEGAAASRVTIVTGLNRRSGLAGAIELFLTRKVLPGIYRKELQRLAEHAEGRQVHEPLPKAEG